MWNDDDNFSDDDPDFAKEQNPVPKAQVSIASMPKAFPTPTEIPAYDPEDESQEIEVADENSADTSGDKSQKPGLTQVATDTHPPTSSPLTSPIPGKASSLPLDIGKPRHELVGGMSFFSRFWGVTKPLSELPEPAANNPSTSSSDEQNLQTTTVTTSPLSSPGGSTL